MKEYLKKLGKTKFQAYILVTIINIATFILYLRGDLQADAQINAWMPLINLVAQMVATTIYQHIEGSIDREAQKQQVYVVPGSAQPAEQQSPVVEPTIDNLSVTEIMHLVGSVNNELNDYIKYIEEHPTEIGKEAALRYLKIKELLKAQGPILPQNESEAK